jgi:hypothetical protein
VVLERCLDKVVARLQWNALQAWREATTAARVRAVTLARHRARCALTCQRTAFAKCAQTQSLLSSHCRLVTSHTCAGVRNIAGVCLF